MAQKRLLYLINTLQHGGFERDVAAICTNIPKSTYLPEVWVLRGGGAYEAEIMQAGVGVRVLPRAGATDIQFALKTARLIARQQFDLVHAFLPAIAFYAALARQFFGLRSPVIYSEGTSVKYGGWRGVLHRWTLNHHCAAFTANSAASRRNLCDMGIAQDRVEIIPNGHNLSLYDRGDVERSLARQFLGVGQQEIAILCVCRLIRTKRLDELIAAASILRHQYAVKVFIVGDGPERQQIEAAISTKRLRQIVTLMGARSDVPILLRGADLFMFPSEAEGLSNSLIEAALSRVPIIACDVPGVRDMLADGCTAMLVDRHRPDLLAEAASKLIESPNLARNLADSAWAHASDRYSIQSSVRRLCSLYESVLE